METELSRVQISPSIATQHQVYRYTT